MFFCKRSKNKKMQGLDKNVDQKVKSVSYQASEVMKEQVNPFIIETVDKADQIVGDIRGITDEQVQQLSRKIKTKPIMVVVIFMVIGYFLGRITR